MKSVNNYYYICTLLFTDVIEYVSVDGPSIVAVGALVNFYARVSTQLGTEVQFTDITLDVEVAFIV